MDVKKLNPWNWFRHEAPQLPAVTGERGLSPQLSLLQFHREMERNFLNLARAVDMGWPHFDTARPLWPSLDITTKDREYVITVEVPGVQEKDLKLEVTADGLLTVSGEKHQETHKGIPGNTRVERSYGTFSRVLSLPDDADRDAVSAFFRNGLLTITCPRRIEAREPARQIEIQKVA
ncbi:Hsp20/alpha crystallin family protein [Asticcacaulis solisilvae]|uniref:Hsp20/alpha crystallin family protein n=1 Tax=Asticcacaulis solisilvae TaxID=1217274 RepID=UPI003FD779B7